MRVRKWRALALCGALICIGLLARSRQPAQVNAVVEPPHAIPASKTIQTQLKKVQTIVAAANADNEKQRREFESQGWAFINTDPPDARVVELDPALLSERELEFQTQLQTNSYSGELLSRVREIALRAREDKTRFVALEALGRSPDEAAQAILIGLFDERFQLSPSSNENPRRQILGYIRPQRMDDRSAEFLLRLMSRSDVSDAEKQVALSQLVGLSLAKGLDEGWMAQLPSGWRDRAHSLYQMTYQGGG